MTTNATNLIWIDLEMTGLVPEVHRIIEMATIVTDQHLNVLAEGPVIAVHQSVQDLAAMDSWNTNQHGKSGLTQRVFGDRQVFAAGLSEDALGAPAQLFVGEHHVDHEIFVDMT